MALDENGLNDEVAHELNPAGAEPDHHPQANPIPQRPADGAAEEQWVDYVVALGADRGFVTGDTEHHDDRTGKAAILPGLSRDELRDLADRLGG